MRSRHPTILEENKGRATLSQDEEVDDVTEVSQVRRPPDLR